MPKLYLKLLHPKNKVQSEWEVSSSVIIPKLCHYTQTPPCLQLKCYASEYDNIEGHFN